MSAPGTNGGADSIDDIDVGLLVARLWRKRVWIAAITAISILSFGVVAFLTPPAYRAATVSVVASPDDSGLSSNLGGLGGLAAIAGIDIGSEGKVEETLAVLRSREFTERFITSHNLMPELFPRKWDKNLKRWKGDPEDWPSMADGFDRFNRKVRAATQDQKTDLVSVAIIWSDPVQAADMANELTALLNKEMRDRAITQTDASVGFLKKELDATVAVDTREAISRLMETQINQRMYANVTEEFALRIVDRAMPPDPKDKIRPKKALMLIIGALIGMFIGCVIVLVRDSLTRGFAHQRASGSRAI